jgi:site-specific recombinase XerC
VLDRARQIYDAQVRQFVSWCHQRAHPTTFPVSPAIVTAWLTERAAGGTARSTLSVALSAIKSAHRDQRLRFDSEDPDLKRAMRGTRRMAVREQKQAAPLRPSLLGEILKSLGDSDLDRRDGAMLSALYMLALRRSELVGIDYQSRGEGLAVLRMSAEGIELEILQSKTAQAESVKIAIDRSHNPRGFAALERWIGAAGIEPGTPLFRRIAPRGGIGGRITAPT